MDIARLAGLNPRPVIRSSEALIVSDRNCGVEIEIENVSRRALNDAIGQHWEVTTDHSLRPADRSAEIRSVRGGACGKALVDALEAWAKYELPNTRVAPHFSWRTGLHVHVDVRDKLPEDIRVLGTHYALLEPYIFNWAGAGRWESRFSMPWWVVTQDIDMLAAMTAKPTSRGVNADHQFTTAVQRFSKYTSLNLAPMMRIGTVEFRHGQSTHDVQAILEYINICLSLVELAVDDGDPNQCIKIVEEYVTKGPEAYMHKYLPPQIADKLYSPLRGEAPLTRDILIASTETALAIAELGALEGGAVMGADAFDTIECIISSRDNAARRARTIQFNQ